MSIKQKHVAQRLSVRAQPACRMKLSPHSACQLALLSLYCVLVSGKNQLCFFAAHILMFPILRKLDHGSAFLSERGILH